MRPRVAWFTPLPPVASGIAAYSAEILPHLTGACDIDVFVDSAAVPAGAQVPLVISRCLRWKSDSPRFNFGFKSSCSTWNLLSSEKVSIDRAKV